MRQRMSAGDRDFPNARLTWTPGSIAPFESAWMVFARVMAMNCLTWQEVRHLLSTSPGVPDTSETEFLSGRWVSIGAYASLLRESRLAIERGFLDTLGFPSSLLSTRGIRQCPECIRAGYHCTLFALGGLQHCPWHHVPLTRGCVKCGSALRTFHPIAVLDDIVCSGCGTRIVALSRSHTDPAIPDLWRAAEDSCTEIVAWWRDVRDREPRANELFGDALGSVGPSPNTGRVQLQWGGIHTIRPQPECWLPAVSATPAIVVKWPAFQGVSDAEDHSWNQLVIQYYRCVRRQIFRRFVRRHRECLSILTSVERSDFFSLERKYACTVCLAYIAWRRACEQDIRSTPHELQLSSSIESAGLPTGIDSLRSVDAPTSSDGGRMSAKAKYRQLGRQWTLGGLSLRELPTSVDLIPHLLYADFMRLWNELEVDHVGRDIKIAVGGFASRVFPWPIAVRETPGERPTDTTTRGYVAVLPEAQSLAQRARERCTQRQLLGCSMFNERAAQYGDVFSWMVDPTSDSIFKLRNYDARIKSHYVYVYAHSPGYMCNWFFENEAP